MAVPESSPGDFADMLDTPKLADYLDVSKPSVNRWRVTGEGPPFIKIGSRVRYRRADVDAWLSKRVVTSTSEADARLGGAK